MTAKLQLSLLGNVVVNLDGVEISGQVPAKDLALLCYLAVTGGRHSRDRLAGLLWGDSPEIKARASLRKSLSDLRKLFGDALIITHKTVAFNRKTNYWLDVEVLESALAEEDNGSIELQQLCEAVDLYRGEFLAGFSVRKAVTFEEWVLRERERLRQLVILGMHRLSEAFTVRGEYASAIEYTKLLLGLEPWHEQAHRQLMMQLARSGQQNAALAQYETCRKILAEELGVEPLPETQALYQRLKTRREVADHNLPSQTTPFIGRKAELAWIAHHIDREDCRLLTLIGAGGIGKTRLALQSAGQALSAFSDGVYFVPLAGINSPEFIVVAIGEAIGCSLSGDVNPKQQLFRHLQQKEMLLILDNFDHLLSMPGRNDSGQELVLDMVNVAPRLKLLVTSRERLNLQAEWLLTMEGLSFPSEEKAFEEGPFEAVELFVKRVRQVQPDFALSPQWTEVSRICRLLDGMPLGIELAANWVPMFSCAQIAQELSRGLDLLYTDLQDVQARHRSMEAVFDHSWELLSEDQQSVFKRLSVFRGGFDRRAAEQVAGATLSTLAALVHKSLLQVVLPGRYNLLEPLRQYAAGKLAEIPVEAEQTQSQHCDYYASFLQHNEKAIMVGARQRQVVSLITADIDNIRSSWNRAASQGNHEAINRALRCLWGFYDIRGWFQEAVEALQKAVDGIVGRDGELDKLAVEPRQILGRVLAYQGWCFWRLGRHRKSNQVLQRGLSCFHLMASETRTDVGFILLQLGMNEWIMGNFDQAKSFSQQSLAIGQEIGDWFISEVSIIFLSYIARSMGDYSESIKLCKYGIPQSHQINDFRGEAFFLHSLAWVANTLGEPAKTRRYLQDAHVLHQDTDDKVLLAERLGHSGTAAYLEGKYAEAKERYLESIEINRETGERWRIGLALVGLGYTTCALGEYEASGQYLRAALQMAMEIGSLWIAMDSLVAMGRLLATSDPGEAAGEQAIELLAFVLQHPASTKEARDLAIALMTELECRLSLAVVAAAKQRGQASDVEGIVQQFLPP